MKVKTNLTPRELELVSKGLDRLAKSQVPYAPTKAENDAEKELLTSAKECFAQAVAYLKEDLSKILK